MGKHGVFDATRAQLPYLCYLGGETLISPENYQVPIPTAATVLQVESEDGGCHYVIDGAFAQADSPGYIPTDEGRTIGPIGGGSLQTLLVDAPTANVHIQYFHECGRGDNERDALPRRFFVDATSGNDANDGRNPWTAWQTIGKVNGETFLPADEVLFKRGETWTGTTLTISSSGTASAYITFGAYGSGARPIIDGNDAVDSLDTNSQNYLQFNGIRCTQGIDSGFAIRDSDYVVLDDCEADDCGNESLSIGNGTHVTASGGVYHDTYQRVGGSNCPNIGISEGAHDILLDGLESYGSTGTDNHGISAHNHAATAMIYNLTIRNCTIYDNDDTGIQIWKLDNTQDADNNILIENNTVYGNGTNQIDVDSSGTGKLLGVTVRDNICKNTAGTDRAMRIRDCNGANVYRNLFYADRVIPVWLEDDKDINFWNNTVYTTIAVTTNWLIWVQGALTENLIIKNNIVEAEHTSPYMLNIVVGTGVVGMDIDYNLYGYTGVGTRWTWLGANKSWANWLADSGQDANSPSPADPLFTNPAGDDFTLQAGSPAIDEGVDVGLPYCDTAPDCGAYERCT